MVRNSEEELLFINKIFLHFMGLYPIGEDATRIQKILHYSSRVICVGFLSLLCCQVTIDILMNTENELLAITQNILNIGWLFLKYFKSLIWNYLACFFILVIFYGFSTLSGRRLQTFIYLHKNE